MAQMTNPGTLRPSGSPRWGPGGCPGSFTLEAPFPEQEDTDAAREGTAAHFHLTEGLEGRLTAVGSVAPNGVMIDQEMVDASQHMISDVNAEILRLGGQKFLLRIETKVRMHKLIHPDNEGTPDVFLVSSEARRIIIWDFKYGHRGHDPFRHWQLIDYLAGVIEELELTPADIGAWEISLRIVQPRYYGADPVKVWNIRGVDVWPLFLELQAAAVLAKTPGAPVITGDHCRDCLAKSVCPALIALQGYILDLSREPIPLDLSDHALGFSLKHITAAIKRLEALQMGLQEVARAKIERGGNIPLWRLGNADTREKWTAPAGEVFALGDILGVDLRKPQEPITPNQARAAGIDATVIKAYAQKPLGAKKLLPADASAAAKAFS